LDADADITGQLVAWRGGDALARDRLFHLVYGELRRIAHRQLGREETGHTLDTNALVHEAYLRLVDQTRVEWEDRSHFFAIAAQAMRRILIDYARRYQALRRGGGLRRVSLGEEAAVLERSETLLALDEGLERLAALDPRLSQVVECRYFAGFTEEETAEALGVTPRTVRRDWVKARAWLYLVLGGEDV
jgi:RNA polymerase sigma factor (TIGR02999 family)